MLLFWTGIKINRRDMLDARGFNRSRIASHAIEAYLIQVKGHLLSNFDKTWTLWLVPCDILCVDYMHKEEYELPNNPHAFKLLLDKYFT